MWIMADKDQSDIPSAPELDSSRRVPQLIKSTESTKPPATDRPEPEERPFWNDDDDLGEDEDTGPGEQYQPIRSSYTKPADDEAQAPQPERPPKAKKKKAWLWPVIILLIVAAAAAAYWFFGKQKAAAPEKTSTTTSQTTKSDESSTTKKIVTKHYDSTNFAVALDYPEGWKVNDTATLLSVTSPEMSLKTADGATVNGHIFLTVQPKQTTLPDFAKGSAVAVLQSEKATYKNPTQNQRAQTYMTFASFATTTGKGWDALYVTGDNGYQVDQEIPMSDIIQTDPLVSVKFLSCTTQDCTGTTKALSLNTSEWKNTAVSDPIKTIIQSFAFQ